MMQRILTKRKIMMNVNKTVAKTMTKTERLLGALQKGDELTAKQITARFGIANPTATVSDLRLRSGFAVYANERKDTKGRVTTKYRIGRPSRAVVAAGYRALAAQAASAKKA
jgi:predicted transcriptional regulator